MLGGLLMSLLHDNEIIKYDVNINKKRIILETIWSHDGSITEFTDVYFNSVEAHYFIDTNMHQNVLSDITEQSLELAWKYNKQEFERGWKYGAILFLKSNPIEHPNEAKNEFINYLSEYDYHFFEINSSYGLSGWIISKSMDIYVNKKRVSTTKSAM